MTHTKRVRKTYRHDHSISRSDYQWMIREAKKWDREDQIQRGAVNY